ncbi:hypothetical protein [Halorubrum halodurans]|uniref:hypothetical protein n=1 Tax=Halorubrum halodurans TaxID=1383851 RepID=UPI001179F96C|nr:hypothetical protein [Halorubrum halodurans]
MAVEEPVLLKFGDVVQNRYIYESDSLRLANDKAWLTLYDARRILNSGVISNKFDEVSLEDVVSFIVEEREDPFNAITGYAFPDESANAETQSWKEQYVEAVAGEDVDANDGGLLGFVETAGAFLTGLIADATFIRRDKGGFDFEDISPNDALKQVEAEYGVEAWVNEEGVLYVGRPESSPNNRHVVPPNIRESPYVISDYNITKGVTPITNVHLTGTQTWQKTGDGMFDGNKALYPIGRATIEGQDGGTYAPDEPLRLRSPEALERAARNRLIDLAMSERNGNFVLNGFASTEPEKLVTMSVGDTLVVAPNIGEYCTKDVDGGVFVVEEVQHRIDTRNGWKVTAEVGAVPDNITTSSVWYLPEKDEEYADLPAYQNDN